MNCATGCSSEAAFDSGTGFLELKDLRLCFTLNILPFSGLKKGNHVKLKRLGFLVLRLWASLESMVRAHGVGFGLL